MNAVMHVAEDDQGDAIVLFDWEGFDAEERTWESIRKIHSSAPCIRVEGSPQIPVDSGVER